MITLFSTPTEHSLIETMVSSVDQLEELVEITSQFDRLDLEKNYLLIKNKTIFWPIEWNDQRFPLRIPDLPLSHISLLSSIFYKLGNTKRAILESESEPELNKYFLVAYHIENNILIDQELFLSIQHWSPHNLAVIYHYGRFTNEIDQDRIEQAYQMAINNSNSPDIKAYSTKFYGQLLLDIQKNKKAQNLAENLLSKVNTLDAQIAMESLLATALFLQLKYPYPEDQLLKIAKLQEKCLQYYESQELKAQAGLLLIDASEISNFQEEYAQSLQYINRAITYFKSEKLTQFLGEAGLRKSILLYTWSKNGQPQYYKSAINAFQNTLKIYTKEDHPSKFADVQHYLALIYAEMPAAPQEKAIWAAFSAAAFQKALAFYSKEKYPYEYAMIAHNFATALMHFPESKLSSNADKAYDLFQHALTIRQQNLYPTERISTLTNLIELLYQWNGSDRFNEQSLSQSILQYIQELSQLTDHPTILSRAQEIKTDIHQQKMLLN